MTMLDAFHFSWDKFETNLKQSYASLREVPDFSDVTLVCADGEQIEAHKVVLATSSPFFFNMLHMDKHPHPRIYMKGLTLTKLSYMLTSFITEKSAWACKIYRSFWNLLKS